MGYRTYVLNRKVFFGFNMLWKFLLIAGLAVGVFGDPVPLDDRNEVIVASYCKANHAEDKMPEARIAFRQFNDCLQGLFDPNTTAELFKNATLYKDFGIVAKAMCSKTPYLKACYQGLVTNMGPCQSAAESQAFVKDTNDMISFVCENDSARLAVFYNEGGIQCLEERRDSFKTCILSMKANVAKIAELHGGGPTALSDFTKEERCIVQDKCVACYVEAAKGCPKPALENFLKELQTRMPPCSTRSFYYSTAFYI